jgi:hypothetical protein
MIVMYLTNEGSDGRGGEVVNRFHSGKPLLAFAKRGVKVSRYPADCMKGIGVTIQTFDSFEDMRSSIQTALDEIGRDGVRNTLELGLGYT